MRTVIITAEAEAAIRANSRPGIFKSEGKRLPNGEWAIPFGDDVIKRLEEHRFPGETLSDVIIRACATMNGRKPN